MGVDSMQRPHSGAFARMPGASDNLSTAEQALSYISFVPAADVSSFYSAGDVSHRHGLVSNQASTSDVDLKG